MPMDLKDLAIGVQSAARKFLATYEDATKAAAAEEVLDAFVEWIVEAASKKWTKSVVGMTVENIKDLPSDVRTDMLAYWNKDESPTAEQNLEVAVTFAIADILSSGESPDKDVVAEYAAEILNGKYKTLNLEKAKGAFLKYLDKTSDKWDSYF